MFDFLKNKLKGIKDNFEKEKPPKPVKPEKKGLKARLVKKITEKTITKSDFNELFDELELTLLQSNVAVDTIAVIKESLAKDLVGKSFKRGKAANELSSALRKAISDVLIEGDATALIKSIKASDKPVSFMFVGTNGAGKTTTIAKFANYLKKKGISVVLAACDTFRAASIEQLEVHGNALGFKVVKHSYGADSAAVAFDALEHARAKSIKVVLIDTAGRSHSNTNLMKELEKVGRVVNPDYTVFVGDALTGNEVVAQCRDFGQANGFDYAILTKTDVDEKGGAIISVSHETGVPILFLGTGQTYDDLKPFRKEELLSQLF
ncbi:MAG: signal recognition particle-docking protein FtsY [Candidatus Nanoarchaeia archaeon]|jgi:fused signal recognition particle receptor